MPTEDASAPGAPADLPAPTPKAVIGKRLPFWRSLSFGEAAFELAAPGLALWSAWWFIGMARRFMHLLDDDQIGPTVVGTVFFGVVGIAGCVGIWMFTVSLRTVVIESACPCCGFVGRRSFDDPASADSSPAACGRCLAYLRASASSRTVEVSEERLEASNMMGLAYELPPERYLPVAKRGHHGHFTFPMPAMCAVCGSPDAPHFRDIGEWGRVARTDFGVAGTIAGIAASEVAGDLGLPHEGSIHHSAPLAKDSPSELLDDGLSHLKAPVCARHTDDAESFGDALEYRVGKLTFASYRYYRAFCELNQIGGELDSTPKAAPTNRRGA